MLRAFALVGLAGMGVLGWQWWRSTAALPYPPPPMPPEAPPVTQGEGDAELPYPPPMMPPPPPQATAPAAGYLSPSDILFLLPSADPEGLLEPAEVLAFCAVESGGGGGFNPNAYRYERHLGEASYGLMQVLASSARDRGFPDPEALYDPATGLRCGILHAAWGRDFLASRLGGVPPRRVWVGAYNAGVGNALRGNLPLSYIAKWEAAYAGFNGA